MTTQPDRSRTARFLDAVTHSGPGYDTTPNATASNTTSRLHHLLDRMQRGVLLPEEAEQLAGLVRLLQARVTDQDGAASVTVSAVRLMNEAGTQRTTPRPVSANWRPTPPRSRTPSLPSPGNAAVSKQSSLPHAPPSTGYGTLPAGTRCGTRVAGRPVRPPMLPASTGPSLTGRRMGPATPCPPRGVDAVEPRSFRGFTGRAGLGNAKWCRNGGRNTSGLDPCCETRRP